MTSYIISQYVMKKHTNVFMPWYFFIKYVKWSLETLVSEVVCPTNLIASIVNRESLWGYYLCENLSFLTQEQQFVFLGTMLYSMLLSIWYFTWEASFIFFNILLVQETNRYECPCPTNKSLKGKSQHIHTCTCNYSCKYWCNFYYKP